MRNISVQDFEFRVSTHCANERFLAGIEYQKQPARQESYRSAGYRAYIGGDSVLCDFLLVHISNQCAMSITSCTFVCGKEEWSNVCERNHGVPDLCTKNICPH
jgi:hypothetical protein